MLEKLILKMTNEETRREYGKSCAKILKETIKDPKGWFSDYLEVEEVGNIVRVYVTIGGPTVWWAFNTTTKRGRLYYSHGDVRAFKNFGKTTYEKLMAFVW